MKEVSIFTRRQIDERDLLRVFERELDLSCESLAYPKEPSVAFLMTSEYEHGFPFSAYFFWREGPVFDKSLAQLAQIFADEFDTDVLFESETSIVGVVGEPWVEEWLLAVPGGGVPTVVTVVDTADGVDVAGEAPAPAP